MMKVGSSATDPDHPLVALARRRGPPRSGRPHVRVAHIPLTKLDLTHGRSRATLCSMTTAQQQHEVPVRLDFEAHGRDFYRAVSHLDNAATKQLDKVDFDPRLRELVRIRASQLNGCAYCVDMHTKDARA